MPADGITSLTWGDAERRAAWPQISPSRRSAAPARSDEPDWEPGRIVRIQALEETSPRQAPAAPAAANGDPVDIGLFLANSSTALSPNGPLATFHTSAERPWLFMQTKSNAPMVLDCAGVAVLRTLFEFTDVPWEVALRGQVKRRRRECPFADA